MTAASTPRPWIGLLATAANFPLVFLGILAIATQSSGDEEIALLNLWAIWGFLQALLGQIGLATSLLDRIPWTAPAILARAGLAAVAAGLVVAPFRSRLFPGHERWVVAVALTAAAVFLIGRLRGERTVAGDGMVTVVVTAMENLVRTVALVALLAADRGGAADLAIVAPFLLSILLLHLRERSTQASTTDDRPAHVWSGVLAALPAMAAYAIVPGLTLLNEVADLDAVSVATSLLRGPLLVATFASAWIIQSLLDGEPPPRHIAFVGPAMVGLHLVVEAFDPGLVLGLVVHGVLSGSALMLCYLAILSELRAVDRVAPRTVVGITAAVVIFGGILWLSARASFIHPFLALTAVASVIGVVVASAPRPEVRP